MTAVGFDERLNKALTVMYGSPPFGLTPTIVREIQTRFDQIPDPSPGYKYPIISFLVFATQNCRFDLSTLYRVVFSDGMFKRFYNQIPVLQEEARTQAVLDAKNFESEVKAFKDIEAAIKNPHLDISELYRYMVALQQGMLFCIEDKLITKAITALRRNPYLYFAYGDEFIELMPTGWEEL